MANAILRPGDGLVSSSERVGKISGQARRYCTSGLGLSIRDSARTCYVLRVGKRTAYIYLDNLKAIQAVYSTLRQHRCDGVN